MLRRLVRWKALWPLSVALLLLVSIWWLFLDTIVERSVESVGTALVGARVDLEGADVRLGEGFVTLRGLQVTNPDQPMKNLVEAREIVADLRVLPLLEKKVFIDTLAFRDVRFGTDREESGAVEEPSEESRLIREQVSAWADQVRVPAFSLEGLGQVVNVAAINPESLTTPAAARALAARADSSRGAWMAQIAAVDPGVAVTSARNLLDSLEGASPRSLGIQGTVRAVQSARAALAEVNAASARLTSLDDSLRAKVTNLRAGLDGLSAFRDRDLAYARGLLRLPRLDAPDLSPSLLGDFAVRRLQPLLYWWRMVDTHIPPGLDPRRRPGPRRARRAGTTYGFPTAADYPAFTLLNGEASFELEAGAAAGRYAATLRNITSAPAVLGAPMIIEAARTGGVRGLDEVGLRAVFDHFSRGIRDSISARLSGISLPAVPLPGIATTMRLGRGATEMALVRTGDTIAGQWTVRSSAVEWVAGAQADRVTRLVREVVTDIGEVDIEIRVSGSIRGPGIAVRSNLGRAIATAVTNRLRSEVASAEASLREEITRRVSAPVGEARALVDSTQTRIRTELTERRGALDQVKADLERRIRELNPLPRPALDRGSAGPGGPQRLAISTKSRSAAPR